MTLAVKDSAAFGLDNWDYENSHVQTRNEINEGRFISSEQVLVVAGPPRLKDTSRTGASGDGLQVLSASDLGSGQNAETLFPVGTVEVATISQQKQLQKVFEIGSKRSYFLPGNHFGNLSLQRILVHGPNLARVAYAYYSTSRIKPIGPSYGGMTTLTNNTTEENMQKVAAAVMSGLGSEIDDIMPEIKTNPGFNSQYYNLSSSLFDQPMGWGFILCDSRKRIVAGFYLECCMTASHNITIQANSTMIMEGMNFQFDRIAPINVVGADSNPTSTAGLDKMLTGGIADLAGGAFGIPGLGVLAQAASSYLGG